MTYTDKAVAKNNGSTYIYAVAAYNDSWRGEGYYKKICRLTAVSMTGLKNTAKKTMKASWKKNSKASGYQIQYSTSASFAKGNKTVNVAKASTLSKTIKKLTKGKTYYARIRVYRKVGSTKYYSSWSGKKAVKIKK